jgi:phosphoserine phosphatase
MASRAPETVPGGDRTGGAAELHHVVVRGRPVPPDAVALVVAAIPAIGGSVAGIRALSDDPVTGFELTVSGAATALCALLAPIAAATGAEIAVEEVRPSWPSTRLVVIDADRILVPGEVVDELAGWGGRAAEVARIAAAAIRGVLDVGSLRTRVAALAGLPVSVLDEVRDHLVLTPEAGTLIRTLQRAGLGCGIVSSGFTQLTDPLVARHDLDFAAANTLEVADGRLTGGLTGDVVDGAGRVRVLARFAEKYGIPLEQTVAVGDFAHDRELLEAAGLGIAYDAVPVPGACSGRPRLDAVLQLLGFAED